MEGQEMQENLNDRYNSGRTQINKSNAKWQTSAKYHPPARHQVIEQERQLSLLPLLF